MRPPLLLLHGALGAADQFDGLTPHLADAFTVHTLDFEGHGRAPQTDRPFRIDYFVDNARAHLDAHDLHDVAVFGYSMGGFVACRLALALPGRVRRIATLGTRYPWDADTARRETRFLDVDKMREKVPQFAAALARRHGDDRWADVVRRTADMLHALGAAGGLGPDELGRLALPVRVMIGDRDTTAGVPESYAAFAALPHGQLQVLPGTPHPLERVDAAHLARALREFLE